MRGRRLLAAVFWKASPNADRFLAAAVWHRQTRLDFGPPGVELADADGLWVVDEDEVVGLIEEGAFRTASSP